MKLELIGENSPSISNIFLNRNINPDSIFRLSEEVLLDPYLIKNLDEATSLIEKVISEKKEEDKIIIVQDPDADGYTSSAIIYNYLKECYPNLSNLKILSQEDKTHGLPVDKLLSEENLVLIIAPDCSSNEEEVHKTFYDKNIPVVVLDHHDADKYSDFATMVNISLDDYPNKKLSGASLCLKFAQMYDKKYGFDFFRNYYDLAAIGIISDMVELNTLETIFIVQQGMRNIKNEFLLCLYEAKSFNLGSQVTPIGISFYISPLLNAVTRVGTNQEKEDLTKALSTRESYDVKSSKRGAKDGDLEDFHQSIARKLGNIKARQDRSRDKAYTKLLNQIEKEKLYENQVLILNLDNEYPSTFNGLIANKIMADYKKPTFVGSYKKEGDKGKLIFSGSARGDDKSDLPKLKQFNQDSNLFIFAEGHEGAHGVSFEKEKEEEIIKYFNEELKEITFEPIYKIDFDVDFKTINSEYIFGEITRYSTFWGRGLEEPTFCLRNVPVKKDTVEIGGSFGNHKITFSSGDIRFIKFNGVSTEIAKKLKENSETTIDIVGTVKLSSFGGKTFYQIFINDFDIKDSKKYLF